MTDCQVCRWAEMTPRERLRARVREFLRGPDPRDAIAHMGRATAGMMAAMAGVPRLTEYDRHREAYARTGDPAELDRMLRHVSPTASA